jgi:hypothetical protein
MCKDNWTTDNVNAEVIIVAPLVRPAEVIDHLMPGPERLPDAGFQQLFFGRDFSIMPMPQYVVRMQNFEFRRESHIFMATLFDQWLVRQPIHDPLIHADVECDVCETNVDDIGVKVAVRRREFGPMSMPEPFNTHHFLKHIGCGHAICSTCLLVKRFLFVNLGLPVCCNVCKVCWLQF